VPHFPLHNLSLSVVPILRLITGGKDLYCVGWGVKLYSLTGGKAGVVVFHSALRICLYATFRAERTSMVGRIIQYGIATAYVGQC